MADVFATLIFPILLVLVIMARVMGVLSKARFIVLDYQRGVKYKRGVFAEVLPPGSYRLNPKKESVEIVDMRPQPFLFEVLNCADALKNPMVLSVTGEMLVNDPRQAVARSKKDVEEGLALIPQSVRHACSRLIVHGASDASEREIREALDESLNRDLKDLGLFVRDVEVNEIWTAPARLSVPAGKA